jgi:hypothetical protein
MQSTLALSHSQTFNHDSFRVGQLESIRSCLAGNDTFVRLATSGGKSIIFQVFLLVSGHYLRVDASCSLEKNCHSSRAADQHHTGSDCADASLPQSGPLSIDYSA